ncbi:uncharacterized protein LOC114525507 [Dendronephthya gigantea]|uniref:uncharacterized protein LOC114525507 n=1 Tax=Dendronephthya gigantea TaxID=151771 RepID=UPI00106A3179|nr:uncharacterized protein LOC114525507 [Dendronephthya gigantea]
MPMLVFLDWNFRADKSNFEKRLLSVTWDRGHVVSEEFYDDRASILDSASLVLVDTTSSDSGIYWCNVFSLPSQHYPVLHFNVTVQGNPTAEMRCPERVNVPQGMNFSCWCFAHSRYFTPKSFWQMDGAPPFLDGRRRDGGVELFLQDVQNHMTGTYICRAQLHSMIVEKKLTLSVLYAPKIRSFNGKLLEDKSMKMTCLADGLPKPTYVIKLSNGLSYTADISGVIVIKDYKVIVNTTYVCIAKNSQGEDQWRLNGILTISKDGTAGNQKSFLQQYVWYIVGGAALIGILLGFLLLRIYQSSDCRKSEEEAEQNDQNSPVYIDPATLPISQGRKMDPLNYIDVHVLPSIPQGGANDNMAVYVDPDTVVSSRERLGETRAGENQNLRETQARKPPEDDDRVYQSPDESLTDDGGEESEENQAEEEVQANSETETTTKKKCPPRVLTKPRANTEPMLGYQDLDSSDEIEENFYHSLRSANSGHAKSHYYVNERVKVKD